MSDRVAGLLVVVLALAFFVGASHLEDPFIPDPVGPGKFPMLISATAILAGLIIILKPDAEPKWPKLATLGRLAFTAIVLILYAYALKPLGFILPTAIAAATMSYQIKARTRASALIGCALSTSLFVIFKFALGLSLFAWPRWLIG